MAEQIQAYWEKNRAIPLVERWYRTLADDQAGNAAWLEAAGNIVQPENVRTIPGGGAFTVTEAASQAGRAASRSGASRSARGTSRPSRR